MMLEALCISALVLATLWFLSSAVRHSRASKVLDDYGARFGALADNPDVPLSVLEKLHGLFTSTKFYPLAVTSLVFEIVRFKFDPGYRETVAKAAEEFTSGQDVDSEIARTTITLYMYASYALPGIGILARVLLRRLRRRLEQGSQIAPKKSYETVAIGYSSFTVQRMYARIH